MEEFVLPCLAIIYFVYLVVILILSLVNRVFIIKRSLGYYLLFFIILGPSMIGLDSITAKVLFFIFFIISCYFIELFNKNKYQIINLSIVDLRELLCNKFNELDNDTYIIGNGKEINIKQKKASELIIDFIGFDKCEINIIKQLLDEVQSLKPRKNKRRYYYLALDSLCLLLIVILICINYIR